MLNVAARFDYIQPDPAGDRLMGHMQEKHVRVRLSKSFPDALLFTGIDGAET